MAQDVDLERWAREALSETEAKRQVRQLREELARAQTRLGIALALRQPSPSVVVVPRPAGPPHDTVAVAVASDWHVEEQVDPETVSGLNEYNLDISKARAERFFQGILALTEISRKGWKIDTLVLALLGDFITGYIHEEYQETNYLSPTEATLQAATLLRAGIDLLRREGNFRQILVPCLYGNHGRTTPRSRVATGYKNSFEWLLYQSLRRDFTGTEGVHFYVASGIHIHLDLGDYLIRFHHGDSFRYQGGIGGLHIPLRKAVDAWNQARRVDLDVLGHWHQLQDLEYAVVNGSLIGWNAYATRIRARFEPPQQAFFLVDLEKRRKAMLAKVWVE